jgi:pimeloyl-ACP methyl ester carboxylesterase
MGTSKFIDINGLKLHYIDYGSEGRPYLVLLHGLNGNAHAFDLVAPNLTASHHVIALDLRGHGDSQCGPPDGYTPPNYLGDIGAFLKALTIEKVSFIGSSMGGAMAMILATRAKYRRPARAKTISAVRSLSRLPAQRSPHLPTGAFARSPTRPAFTVSLFIPPRCCRSGLRKN